VLLEGLGKLKKKLIYLIGTQTLDLPACSILMLAASVYVSMMSFTARYLWEEETEETEETLTNKFKDISQTCYK
jgi:hypothetical protein